MTVIRTGRGENGAGHYDGRQHIPGSTIGKRIGDVHSAPSAFQYVKYAYGARLPDSMRDWVTKDLAGPRAALRMVARWSVPCILLLVPMLFVPADWLIRANMTIPILLPYIFFSIALNRVYRRHRLSQHGLDPDLVNKLEREKNADVYDEYYRKYRGGRN